ncbi:hypothetical protein [Oleispirillum naphthae]|uniref:hypothetical protein n=1 Tax=Oleispirillum naphthae TaxID=2838853 RepID=UPI0030825184
MTVIKMMKGVAILLGVMIVGGLALMAYGVFFYKAAEKNRQPEITAAPSAPAVMGDFDAIGLGQPTGSSVAAVTAQGGLVYVTVRGGGEPDRVLVVDPARRRVLGRIEMGAADSRPPRPAN